MFTHQEQELITKWYREEVLQHIQTTKQPLRNQAEVCDLKDLVEGHCKRLKGRMLLDYGTVYSGFTLNELAEIFGLDKTGIDRDKDPAGQPKYLRLLFTQADYTRLNIPSDAKLYVGQSLVLEKTTVHLIEEILEMRTISRIVQLGSGLSLESDCMRELYARSLSENKPLRIFLAVDDKFAYGCSRPLHVVHGLGTYSPRTT